MGVMPIITSPRRSYDFVVCGAGTSGSVGARRLADPLWPAAHPAETLTRLYAEEPTLAHIGIDFAPTLAHIGIDFAPTLTRLLTALCDGMTTAHK